MLPRPGLLYTTQYLLETDRVIKDQCQHCSAPVLTVSGLWKDSNTARRGKYAAQVCSSVVGKFMLMISGQCGVTKNALMLVFH